MGQLQLRLLVNDSPIFGGFLPTHAYEHKAAATAATPMTDPITEPAITPGGVVGEALGVMEEDVVGVKEADGLLEGVSELVADWLAVHVED